ncbi:MAG: hypothetical protein NXI18_13585 [Alphaproteobacteria bacterium]|nr:hypothetical protein [Alphaproteobacteria bacterium]
MATSNQVLVVPVDVSALAVNEQDANDATPYFSGANSVFTDQAGASNAFIGANVNRSLKDSPAQPLESGVHLHWALPPNFTHSNAGGSGDLSFPPSPNRWLVNRFKISGNTAERTSWVVLGDLMNDSEPDGQTAISLPTHPTGSGQNFQYSGEFQAFDASWSEPTIPEDRTFKTLAGMHLTAVANGHPVFASFYPNCRGVFGFTDPLTDIHVGQGDSVQLMYSVTGWYSDSTNDPLSGGLTLDQVQDQLLWTFPDTGGATVDRSLYHGLIEDVVWHPDQRYLQNYSGTLPTVELDLGIGNNPPEAVSCYLQNQVHPDLDYFQVLLNGFLEGLLGTLATPQPGQLAALEEALHQNRFQAINGGYIYSIQSDGKAIDLPVRLGDALNTLNQKAQTVQRLEAEIASYQWQLFADWYRIFMSDTADQQTSYNIAYNKLNGYSTLSGSLATARSALQTQTGVVTAQLPPGASLVQVPAARYWQPSDPAVLLSGDALSPTGRARSAAAGGLLPCRLQDQLITAAAANGVTVTSGNFAASALPANGALPASDAFGDLVFESLMLNASLLTAITGATISYGDIQDALLGTASPVTLTGTAPTVGSVTEFAEQPWIPLLAYWEVTFAPTFATTDRHQTQLLDYSDDFFTGGFTIDPDTGGSIVPSSTDVPTADAFWQSFAGETILSNSAIAGFAKQLATSQDPTLKASLAALQAHPMAVQALSGLTASFLMQQLTLQLNVAVPNTNNEYGPITTAVAQVVQGAANVAPNFNGYYNPIRSGCMKLDLTLVDIFGQKRKVVPSSVTIADSMTLDDGSTPVPDITYLPPRLAQPGRLLFRFLASDATELEEMNVHPATSPICGWLLPNHLSRGLFIYDGQGAGLGSLTLNGAGTGILWQSTPGNNRTIDQDAATVMQDQQPQLRDLVLALNNGTAAFFDAFLTAIEQADATIDPQQSASDNDLAALIQRPLAVVQASLALDLQGDPQFNQSWAVLSLAGQSPLAETDNAFTKVQFPAILGDLRNLDDGLVGYFTQGNSGYDWSNFYAMGAQTATPQGVQGPTQNTLTLTAPPACSDSLSTVTETVLMLLDPRVAVHATTGILPTKSIRIPPDMYADTLRTLETTFLTTPVLQGGAGMALPLPTEAGYQWSWVQERIVGGTATWEVSGDLSVTVPDGPWPYTPQTVREGWLRLDPALLTFDLVNADDKAIVAQGVNDGLKLEVTNRQGRPVAFAPGTPMAEGTIVDYAVLYLHFGTAVPQDKVGQIQLQADGWSFAAFTDALYGTYWCAAASRAATLGAGDTLTVNISCLDIDTRKQQATFYFNYYGVSGINDGTFRNTVSVQAYQG